MPPKRARNANKELLSTQLQREGRVMKQTEKGEFQRIELEKAQQRRATLQKKREQAKTGDKENQNPSEQSQPIAKHKRLSQKQHELVKHVHIDDEDDSTQSDENDSQDENIIYQHPDLSEQISFQKSTYDATPLTVRHIHHSQGQPQRIDLSPPPFDDHLMDLNLSPCNQSEGLRAEKDTNVKQLKRKHPESEDENEPDSEESPHLRKRSKKADDDQAVKDAAQVEFQIRVCTENGFPESDARELNLWAEECWDNANRASENDFKLTKATRRLITKRVSTIRGRLKDRAVFLVPGKYGFVLPMTDEDIKTNKALAAKLLANLSYIYKDPNELSGIYEHPILADIIVSQFFNKKRNSDGIIFSAAFNPIPESLIALVFTTVHFAIERWKSGTVVHKGSFTEFEYHPIYDQHLKGIQRWKGFNDKTGRAFAKHQQFLFEIGSKFAGVDWEHENENESDPFAEDRLGRAAATLP